MTITLNRPHYFPATTVRLRHAVVLIAGLAACSSTEPDVIPPVATTLTVVSGNQQVATVGAALSSAIVVKLVDQNGAPVVGATFTFITSGGSSVGTSSAITDANGQLSVAWTLGTTSGADTLTAVSSGLATTIVATATPGAVANIAVVDGGSQSGAVGATLAAPITVKVTDQYGNAIAGATVAWNDDANGTFAHATVLSDANGTATNIYTLGPNPGPEDISVQVSSGTTTIATTLVEIGS